jgi:hypothetical protein
MESMPRAKPETIVIGELAGDNRLAHFPSISGVFPGADDCEEFVVLNRHFAIEAELFGRLGNFL